MLDSRTVHSVSYTFSPKWKEMLVCTCGEGEFIIEFSMGVPTAFLPSKSQWEKVCPVWAVKHWDVLADQLKRWCDKNGVALAVDDMGTLL